LSVYWNSARTVGWPLALIFCWACMSSGHEQKHDRGKRAVTVRDAIAMTRLGLPDGVLSGPVRDGGAKFSPDGKRLVIVLKKGNLNHNTNDYSVLLYETEYLFRSPEPNILLTFSSSSNREAIKNLKWLADSKTIAFVGENPGENPQIYEFAIPTNRLERLTNHPTPVMAFDVSGDGKTIVFEADPSPDKASALNAGDSEAMVITDEEIVDILTAGSSGLMPRKTNGEELFLIRKGGEEINIPLDDVLYSQYLPPLLSQDGRYAVFGLFVREVPASWSEYKERWLQQSISSPRGKGEPAAAIARFVLLDTETRKYRPLLNSPVSSWLNDAVVWAPDGDSVVVSGVHLPLDDATSPAGREARRGNTYVVEVQLPGLEATEITTAASRVEAWSSGPGLVLSADNSWSEKAKEITFKKQGNAWREISSSTGLAQEERSPSLLFEEDTNSPPKIYASNLKTREKALLLDLNPQFSELNFGRVEVVTWKATDGHEVQGGLFFPPNYKAGKKYPAVIQTHGFLTQKFYMDGPWSSAFAARPLAAKEIIVLQVGYSTKLDDPQYDNTPLEAPREMAAYEGAVDYLERRGLIDCNRVGIIGFSRTVYKVAYTLTHSRYQFAAATLADGIDGGYFEYLLFHVQNDPLLNGGPPFGQTLSLWLKNAPEFSMDKVHPPIRLEAYGPASALGKWNWFSGLLLLGKPVDFIYLPRGTHLLNKPAERLVSQQGNVDWFCFWLKDEEDEDLSKRDLYSRWQLLRDARRRDREKSQPLADGPPNS
jgi:dipeptidyl aminopeptidase/acylaminoacyl peptidase